MKKFILLLIMVSMFQLASAEDKLSPLEEGKYQVEVGNNQEGVAILRNYLKTNSDPEAFTYLIRAERQMVALADSNNHAKAGQKKYPDDTEIVRERILTLEQLIERETKSQWRKERYKEEYYQVYKGYLEMTNYGNSEEIFKLGNEYFKDDLYEQARDIFLKDRNENIKNLFGAATTTRFLGEYRKSASLYTRVLNVDPNFYEAYLGRGSAYQLSGDLNQGIKDMEKYLEYKQDKDVYIAIANMYMSLERYSSAKSVLERASSNYPSSQEIRDLLVEVYSKLQR